MSKTAEAEKKLDNAIREYNSKVPQTFWFQFDKHEKGMFIDMMQEFSDQQSSSKDARIAELEKRLEEAEKLYKSIIDEEVRLYTKLDCMSYSEFKFKVPVCYSEGAAEFIKSKSALKFVNTFLTNKTE